MQIFDVIIFFELRTVQQKTVKSLAKVILQGTVKGEKDKADRARGRETTSGNGQAWSKNQNTQESKRTLFNKTEQDKTCKFSM